MKPKKKQKPAHVWVIEQEWSKDHWLPRDMDTVKRRAMRSLRETYVSDEHVRYRVTKYTRTTGRGGR